MQHGHIFDFPEFFLFVDQYIRKGTPMPLVARPIIKGGSVSTTVKSSTKLLSANLHYTSGPHEQNGKRQWTTVPLIVDGQQIHGAAPPKNATVWYIDVRDERKAVTSSEVMVVTQDG
jgi:hypothetical protein